MKSFPSLFYTNSDRNFLDALIEGYITRSFDKEVLLILPNHRLCRAAHTLFQQKKSKNPPSIIAMSEIEEWLKKYEEGIEPEGVILSSLQQMMLLLPLVMHWKKDLSYKNAVLVTYDLMALLEDLEREACNTQAMFQDMSGNMSEHSRSTNEFLKIVFNYWPEVLKEQKATTPMRHRNDFFKKLAAHKGSMWEDYIIILAGSTGSQPATRYLMKRLLEDPKHYIILPCVNPVMPEVVWNNLESDHPFYCMKFLMDVLHVSQKDLIPWEKSSVTQMPRKMACYVGDNHDHEALTIACAIRDIIHKKAPDDDDPIGLITNDRLLIRKIKHHLARWDVVSDDSAGKLLEFHPHWIYFVLLLEVLERRNFTFGLLAMLNHPLMCLEWPEASLQRAIEMLERHVLRQENRITGWKAMEYALSIAEMKVEEKELCIHFVETLKKMYEPLHTLFSHPEREKISFKKILQAHITVFEASMANACFPSSKEKGKAVYDFLEELVRIADNFSFIALENYGDILKTLIKYRNYSVEPPNFLPSVMMLSPMDARFLPFRYAILAGLNEDSWPTSPKMNHWTHPKQLELCGFPPPEKSIGQSAHDFLSFFSSVPHVILTYNRQSGFDAKETSRFLSCVEMTPLENTMPPYADWAHALDKVIVLDEEKPVVASVTAEIRPKKYHVSDIEMLIRDPYAVYAAQILQLKKLPSLETQEASKGSWLHKVCEYFILHVKEKKEDEVEAFFMETGEAFFPRAMSLRDQVFWKEKLKQLSQWMAADYNTKKRNNVTIHAGITGSLCLQGKKGMVTLYGKMDRCEITKEGILKIVDYKTYSVPQKEEILSGYSPQLGLLALIAKEKNIESLNYSVFEEAEYWQLMKKKPEIMTLSHYVQPISLDVFLEHVKEACMKLLHDFSYEDIAYIAAPDPTRLHTYSPYLHLGRVK